MKTTFFILIRSPKFIIGASLLLLIALTIFIYPLINREDPTEMIALAFEPPSADMFLGSDNFGRDIFLELMYGTRNSLYVGITAGLIATLIGITVGLVAGYTGGVMDDIMTAATNMFIVIPSFIILILVSVSIQTRSTTVTAVIIGLTAWPWTARAVRAQASSLRQRDHVNIARISGHRTSKILLYEVLPYVASYVMMAFILQTAFGILQEAAISMLGLGPYNTITLGIMLNWALIFEAPAAGAWWAFIPTALVITFITFGFFLMNTGMDEVFNPKIRS